MADVDVFVASKFWLDNEIVQLWIGGFSSELNQSWIFIYAAFSEPITAG